MEFFSLHPGGAMRLPGQVNDPVKIHFLTDFYANKFGLNLVPFNNSDKDGFLKFYNDPPVTFRSMFLIILE